MVIYDRVIKLVQKTGGASILFDEISSRMRRDKIPHVELCFAESDRLRQNSVFQKNRLFERYRDVVFPSSMKFGPNDIFHSTCYRIPATPSCKVITTVHDFTYEKVIRGVPARIHSWQKNKAIFSSDHIICVSHNTKKDFLDYFPKFDEEKISVVHNGVSSKFHFSKDAIIKPYVLFVGQRARYKNFTSLVAAMVEVKDFELACVGGGAFTKKEINMLDSFIPGRYRHFGYVSESELNTIYSEAFCFVYPSYYEGFGIPILESMKSGCPVVALNSSSIPEVADDAAILLDSGQPGDIANAIKTLLNSSVRADYVTRGLSRSDNFSWEKCYSETLQVYRRIWLS